VKQERFTLVHALRGLAALWVVFFHVSTAGHISGLRSQLPSWADLFFSAGHLGVAIFFALSGFVITHSVAGASITASYIGRFALRRSIRLDPPYWASILFVVVAGYLSAQVKGEGFQFPTFPQTLAHLFYLQTLLGFPQINWVYWTLTYEIQFYLVLVLLITPLAIARAVFSSYLELKEAHEATIKVLLRAIEAKDPYVPGFATMLKDNDYITYVWNHIYLMTDNATYDLQRPVSGRKTSRVVNSSTAAR